MYCFISILSIAASGSMSSSSTASATPPALIGSKRRRCGDGRVGVRRLACDWSVLLRGVACRLSRGFAWKYSEMTGMLDSSGSSSTRGCTFAGPGVSARASLWVRRNHATGVLVVHDVHTQHEDFFCYASLYRCVQGSYSFHVHIFLYIISSSTTLTNLIAPAWCGA